MLIVRKRSVGWPTLVWLLFGGGLALLGCRNTPVDLQNGPAPLRGPPPKLAEAESYEDSLTGGQVFAMYCSSCHNPRPLAERPFSSYQNVAAHMRVRANLTGKEYAKLMEFLRRWHDVPPPHPPLEPPPKRFFFNQPIPEQQEEIPAPKPMPPVPVAVPSR
ncbi:MAG TPA: hypothetical protein VNH11_29335 [Pirellulales bacterium]|nr:hypothetical protein [Pirellulales bacterium]